MAVWTPLMIILALISTVQLPNSTAQQTNDNNSYWEKYLRSSARHWPKRTHFFYQDTTATTAITSSYKEDQKNEPVINIKNLNVRDLPPANLTKSLFTNENTINITNKQASTGKKLRKKRFSPIDFPTPTVPINKFIPDPQVIEKCSLKETFCVKVDNYPRQDLTDLFRTSKYMSTSFFGTDIVTNEMQTKISNSNLESFCGSREEIIFPQLGITKNNEWHFIIQDLNINNTHFKQGIRMEKCINAGENCKFNNLLPFGHSSSCVQKYIYKKMVGINDSKEVYYEHFKIPSFCECMYSKIADITTMFHGRQSDGPTC